MTRASIPRLARAALCLACLLSVPVRGFAQNDPNRKDWVQLFNGKNLDGWDVTITGFDLNDNFGKTFRVENGVLKTAYDQYGAAFNNRFGHLFYREKFSHYVIAVEYRFVGEQAPGAPAWAFRNSGIMVHSQSARSMGKDQDFPISIEVQLLGGSATGERSNANLCTPGTHVEMDGKLVTAHCVNSASKTYRGDGWVRVEAEVLGDTGIRHLVDAQVVLAYQKPQIGGGNVSNFDPEAKRDGLMLQEGYIALQSESHPIEFRKVELLNLAGCTDPKASTYKAYFVKQDNTRCRYAGGRDSPADAAPTHRTAEEIQREMEASRALDATRDPRAILSAYSRKPSPASLEASRAEIARIESRMAETQRQIDAGQASQAALAELQRQYSAEKVRYEQIMASREPATTGVTGRPPAEVTLASIEKEIVLVKAQVAALEQRVRAGTLSNADPELVQLRGELAALQQEAANLRK